VICKRVQPSAITDRALVTGAGVSGSSLLVGSLFCLYLSRILRTNESPGIAVGLLYTSSKPTQRGCQSSKATREQTGGQYTLVEILAPEGYPGLLHVHHQEDEGFYILEGELTLYVGDQTIKAHPGSFVFGPKDVPHAFTVDSGRARLLFVLSPAGFEDLIREMGEPARKLTIPPPPEAPPDEAEMQRMAAIAARYGKEILEPPPGQ
jgi:quercetin dioxygenase-like cupin family protein